MSNHYASQTRPAEITDSVECQRADDGHSVKEMAKVVIERELPVYINGEYLITASITPAMIREFVTGYLFGQGFIENIDELEKIDIENNAAQVTMKDPRKILQRTRRADYRIVSGGGKAVFLDEMSLPYINTQMKVGKKEIFKAMNTVLEKARIYQKTEGVHATGLFTPEANIICIVEDIGRHNTLDKVIGYALINEIDCSQTFLASTGRMASEMVTKLCRAGVPVVATKTAATEMGLEIGKKCGLTIIGFVRDTGTRINTDMEVRIVTEPGMSIYTNAERIILKE